MKKFTAGDNELLHRVYVTHFADGAVGEKIATEISRLIERQAVALKQLRKEKKDNDEMAAVHIVAMGQLKEHYESNDPYVDDYPSARHEGARHRAVCQVCSAYARYLKTPKGKREDQDKETD